MANIEDDLISRDMLDIAEVTSQKINNLFSTLPQGEVDIPNIGITYNNKLVEIIQSFKRKGVKLDENLLIIVINNYLIHKVNEASLILISYRQTFCQKSQIAPLRRAFLEQRRKLADRYKALDDEIFNFSLEKDIVDAILEDIRRDREKGANGGLNKYNDEAHLIIADYKRDLKQLGVSDELIDTIPDFVTGIGSL